MRYNTLYYLLFVLLITGAFSSMAQNNYGNLILGGVAFAFSLLFIAQLIGSRETKPKTNWISLAELTGLALLSFILALRVFYIHFQFAEILFVASGVLLIIVYAIKLITSWSSLSPKNLTLALLMVVFHASILAYIGSMSILPFAPTWAQPIGSIAFALMLLFVVVAFLKKGFIINGEKVTAFQLVIGSRDRSIVLGILFVLFSAYMGLTQIGLLPKLYTDVFPQAYFNLVNQAETGQEKPINGEYRYQEFKRAYDKFIKDENGKDDTF